VSSSIGGRHEPFARHLLSGLDICFVMFDAPGVRTTLDVDEDVLLVAKQLARQRGSTTGRVLSALARQALQPARSAAVRNGVRLFLLRRNALLDVNVLVALFALAVRHQGRLVTFDKRIPRRVVVGATPRHLELLGQ
jgi:hypothetical protein